MKDPQPKLEFVSRKRSPWPPGKTTKGRNCGQHLGTEGELPARTEAGSARPPGQVVGSRKLKVSRGLQAERSDTISARPFQECRLSV
jgi:hypothetical protein